MASSLFLDPRTNDLALDSAGNIAKCTDQYALAQNAACAIKLFRGEAIYDTTQGVPYFEQILGRAPSLQVLKSRFNAAARSVAGVASSVTYITDITDRIVSGQVQITDATGVTVAANF